MARDVDVSPTTILRWEPAMARRAAKEHFVTGRCSTGAWVGRAMFDPVRFYRPAEVRELARAPHALVYRALERGDLRAIRRGRVWLIPGRAVIEWVGRQAEPGP